MRRLLVVLLVLACAPAVASAAVSKGTWSGKGGLKARVAKGDCKKLDGMDETGNPKTKEVRGVCLDFQGGHSYQAKCTFPSGVTVEQTVTAPSGYVVARNGVYNVTEKTDNKTPNTYRRVTNSVRITFRGKRATGVATYKSAQGGLPGESTCEGKMTIKLRHR